MVTTRANYNPHICLQTKFEYMFLYQIHYVVAICSLERLQSSCELIKHRRERNGRDLVDFLILWMNMLTQLTAAATCARIASATMDYMSDGRSRVWLFGYESHSLGEAWPDVLGVTIIVVVTAMFMLGLEVSDP